MHIFKALMDDHAKLRDLLQQLVSLDENDKESRRDLIADLRDVLVPHSRAEESVLYNSMRAIKAGPDEAMHGYKEHMEAEALLRLLQVEDTVHVTWKATAEKLKQGLEHHIEEEESKIFEAARKAFSKEEAEKLGELFEQLKPQIQDQSFMKNSLDLMLNLMPPRFAEGLKSIGISKH